MGNGFGFSRPPGVPSSGPRGRQSHLLTSLGISQEMSRSHSIPQELSRVFRSPQEFIGVFRSPQGISGASLFRSSRTALHWLLRSSLEAFHQLFVSSS
eukprot:5632141-Pyramimonas_sp.AAC.1